MISKNQAEEQKSLLKDYFWQAGEKAPVLNTPSYPSFYILPVDIDAIWVKMTKVNPWLTQAEKECIERILDISKGPIKSQTIWLSKGQGSEQLWGFREMELRKMTLSLCHLAQATNSREKRCGFYTTLNKGLTEPLINRQSHQDHGEETNTQRAAKVLLAKNVTERLGRQEQEQYDDKHCHVLARDQCSPHILI